MAVTLRTIAPTAAAAPRPIADVLGTMRPEREVVAMVKARAVESAEATESAESAKPSEEGEAAETKSKGGAESAEAKAKRIAEASEAERAKRRAESAVTQDSQAASPKPQPPIG